MNTQQAIEILISATKAEAQKLVREGTSNGEFAVVAKINCRLDELEKIKLELEVAHYHYSKFEPWTRVKGLDWAETCRAFFGLLARDSSLSRLASPKDESS